MCLCLNDLHNCREATLDNKEAIRDSRSSSVYNSRTKDECVLVSHVHPQVSRADVFSTKAIHEALFFLHQFAVYGNEGQTVCIYETFVLVVRITIPW